MGMILWGYRSIDGVVSNADALNGSNSVGWVGSLGLGPVVGSVTSAVGFVPGVVGDDGIPESVVSSSVGQHISHEAGSEVGLEESRVEVNPDEVSFGVVVLEIEAFQVTIVPGDIEGRTLGGDGFLGSVPIVVALDEGGLGSRQ